MGLLLPDERINWRGYDRDLASAFAGSRHYSQPRAILAVPYALTGNATVSPLATEWTYGPLSTLTNTAGPGVSVPPRQDVEFQVITYTFWVTAHSNSG